MYISKSNISGTMSDNRTNGGNVSFSYPEGYESVMEIMRIVSICCYVTIVVLSALGNTAIIAIILRNKNMQTKANVLIVNMAISDLVATIVTLPRMIDVEVSGSYQWKVSGIIGEVLCKIIHFVREASCAVSIFSLVAIAVDRFFAIVIPLVHRPVFIGLKWLVPIIWLTSIGVNAFYFYAFRLRVYGGELMCRNMLSSNEEKIFDTFRFVILIALPIVDLILLYSAIITKMTRQNIPGANIESFAKNRRRQNQNIVKLAVVIVVLFVICWLPFYIGLLLNAYRWSTHPPPQNQMTLLSVLNTLFTILTYASFAVNPYVCLIFSSNFRRGTRRTFYRSTNPSTTRALTQMTSRNPNAPRALSVSNLDISLGNLNSFSNAQNPSREIPGNDLETSMKNNQEAPLPNSPTPDPADLSELFLEDPENSTLQRMVSASLDEKYLKDPKDIPNSDVPRGISTSLNDHYLRNIDGDLNRGFEP